MSGPKIDQKEYLKRYLSGSTDSSKKKKRKKEKTIRGKSITIIDANLDVGRLEKIGDDDLEVFQTGEDAPQVVGVIDDRPAELRALDFKNSSRWKVISDDNGFDSDLIIQELDAEGRIKKKDTTSNRKKGVSFQGDSSPVRRSPPPRRRDSDDASPPRRQQRRDSDTSPPRRNQSRSTPDQSPPRSKRVDSDEDLSPVRKNTRESADRSPPRRRRESSRSPGKRKRRQSEDRSPPRRKRYDSPDKIRNQRDSPNHSTQRSSGRDLSPPRRNRRESPEPPRRNRRESPEPPRRDRNRWNSPPSRDRREHRDSSPPRRKVASEGSPGPSSSKQNKMEKTLDGKMAGLQSAKALRVETEKFREREKKVFEAMDEDMSGRDASVVRRDRKTGRIRNMEEELERERMKDEKERERKEIYDRWGKGVKQVEDHARRRHEEQHEMSKPMARYAGDDDLEEYLRNQEREGDPMLAYLREKEREKKVGGGKVLLMPKYQGSYAQNRFAIPPGYRWDGVDRSNGYEKKYFDVQSRKKAGEEEAYRYSTEDM